MKMAYRLGEETKMENDWSANFGIFTESPIDVESSVVDKFAAEVTSLVPELDSVERDKAKKTWRLIQSARKGHARLPREIEIDSDGLAAASSSGLSPDERVDFLCSVAKAAEHLELSKFNTTVVDLKYIFRVPHWGNHHELIVDTLLTGSPFAELPRKLGAPIHGLGLKTGMQIPDKENIVCVVSANPQTTRSEIRTGEYDGDDIRIVCGIARVSDFWKAGTFEDMFVELRQIWKDHLETAVIKGFVSPLEQNAVPSEPLNHSE